MGARQDLHRRSGTLLTPCPPSRVRFRSGPIVPGTRRRCWAMACAWSVCGRGLGPRNTRLTTWRGIAAHPRGQSVEGRALSHSPKYDSSTPVITQAGGLVCCASCPARSVRSWTAPRRG